MEPEISAFLPAELTKEQHDLLRALQDRDAKYTSRLADMYIGALQAMKQTNNPERLVHAAHSMRELLEKLPYFYDGAPVRVEGKVSSNYLKSITGHIRTTQKKSQCYDSSNGLWSGEMDESLIGFLKEVEKIVVEQELILTRTQRTKKLLHSLDPMRHTLPGDRLSSLAKTWLEYDGFFQRVSHHDTYPSDEEFSERIAHCTKFLLSQMQPATFDTMDALDKLIEEAERNA